MAIILKGIVFLLILIYNFLRGKNYFMEEQYLENILLILTEALKENNFGEDNKRIQNLCNLMKDLQNKITTNIEIDNLEKEINYLEIKYDIFNDLSYYFDPLCVRVKSKMHNDEVKKIREENKGKLEYNIKLLML